MTNKQKDQMRMLERKMEHLCALKKKYNVLSSSKDQRVRESAEATGRALGEEMDKIESRMAELRHNSRLTYRPFECLGR